MDQSIIPTTPAAQLATQATGSKRNISPEEREKRRQRMAVARAAKRANRAAVPEPTTQKTPAGEAGADVRNEVGLTHERPVIPAPAPRTHLANSERVELPQSSQRVHIAQGIAIPVPVRLIRPA